MSGRITTKEALCFQVEEYTDVSLVCPWCFDTLWITGAKTLGDVVQEAQAHDCDEGEAS